MNRLISILLVPILALVLTTTAFAAPEDWNFNTYDPAETGQTRSFTLDFVALSTVSTDKITVTLFQDGNPVATKVTDAGGDSGTFNVTVPSDGTYEFTMTAKSSEDSTTKNSPTRTTTVKGPQVTVVNQTTSTGDNTGGAATAAAATDGTGAEDGNTQGATTATEDTNGDGVIDDRDLDLAGRVGQDGATTNAEEDASVLGEEDTNDSSNTWAWVALAVLGAGGVIYYFFYRRNKQDV